MFAPIAVFGYNRPSHLRQCLKAIETNPEALFSEIFIFIDGPKDHRDGILLNQLCKEVAAENFKFGNKHLIFRERNLGLANSIQKGINHVLSNYNSIIVIEDDIVLASTALKYLNEGLHKYRDDISISSISAYQYPIGTNFETCVALRGADCWGWATWKDRWGSTSFDSQALATSLRAQGLSNELDLDGKMNYSEMLNEQSLGKIDSWAICWHVSMFLQNRYCIYPPKSLATNIGTDGSGVHSGKTHIFDTPLSNTSTWNFPEVITEDLIYRNSLIEFYAENRVRPTLLIAILRKMKRYFKKYARL